MGTADNFSKGGRGAAKYVLKHLRLIRFKNISADRLQLWLTILKQSSRHI
jgi:hypothetical protein